MLKIEEYIARRKKEDNLNELNLNERNQNIKICVDYIFEYFNNYLDTTEAEEKTVLHCEKLDKYRKQLNQYDSEIREWAVSIYDVYGKQIDKHIGNTLKDDDFFFLYNTDSEFRSVSYDCYNKLIRKCPFLKEQTEMLFLFIKNYHRVQSQKRFDFGMPLITEDISDWIENTWAKNQVNITAFAFSWVDSFFNNEDIWPVSHRKKSHYSFRKYDYDCKQKSNLFNIDSLYRKMPKKSFIKGKKQEFEMLFMYYWLHDMMGDDDGYWQEYLGAIVPVLENK